MDCFIFYEGDAHRFLAPQLSPFTQSKGNTFRDSWGLRKSEWICTFVTSVTSFPKTVRRNERFWASLNRHVALTSSLSQVDFRVRNNRLRSFPSSERGSNRPSSLPQLLAARQTTREATKIPLFASNSTYKASIDTVGVCCKWALVNPRMLGWRVTVRFLFDHEFHHFLEMLLASHASYNEDLFRPVLATERSVVSRKYEILRKPWGYPHWNPFWTFILETLTNPFLRSILNIHIEVYEVP